LRWEASKLGSNLVAHMFTQKVLNFCENFTQGKTVKFLVCYIHFIQSRPQLNFLFFWASNQPCCLLQCSGTILRVRLRCPLVFLVVPTGWETFFSSRRYSTYSLFLIFFWILILDILPTTMLGYYSLSASLIPSEIFSSSFWSIGSLLPIGRHSTSLRSARLQTSRLLSWFLLFFFGPTCLLFDLSITLRLLHDLSKVAMPTPHSGLVRHG
jgi:hypothetical protein